jgi:hypothetical protein
MSDATSKLALEVLALRKIVFALSLALDAGTRDRFLAMIKEQRTSLGDGAELIASTSLHQEIQREIEKILQ